MTVYRTGIIGTGFGVSSHLPALLAHPRFEVVALASPANAERIARERSIPHAFASGVAMIAGCELDAVVVAAPPFAHLENVLAALAAGKHVLCEKPFALDVEGARAMVDAAQRAGTACGIAHEFRFVPQIQALRQLIVNDHLVPLREIESTYFRPILQRDSGRPRSWWFERERGGGITGAIGSHLIDQCTHLAGRPPKRATGFRRLANPRRRDDMGIFASTVDDGTFALLDYGDGLIARITVDGTPSVESFTCAVHAENRTAVASGKSLVELTLFSIDPDETSELGCKPSPYAKYESINSNVPLLMELYDEWVKQIETGSSALPTFQEGLVTQEVLSAIGYSI